MTAVTRLGITHKPSNTKLRVFSSNAKAAFGIVGVPLAVLDEPGAFEVTGGELMYDALQTAQGKPGSPLKVVYIVTLAPAQMGWWHNLVGRGNARQRLCPGLDRAARPLGQLARDYARQPLGEAGRADAFEAPRRTRRRPRGQPLGRRVSCPSG